MSAAIRECADSQPKDGAEHGELLRVSNAPNHVGVTCEEGSACPNQERTRTLLDLFEVGSDPLNGKTAVIYADDILTTTSSGDPLPQLVLGQQN